MTGDGESNEGEMMMADVIPLFGVEVVDAVILVVLSFQKFQFETSWYGLLSDYKNVIETFIEDILMSKFDFDTVAFRLVSSVFDR